MIKLPNLAGERQITDAKGVITDIFWLYFDTLQKWIYNLGSTDLTVTGRLVKVAGPAKLGQSRYSESDLVVLVDSTQANLATLAATLTADDAGLLVNVTDYAHVLQWTGSAWQWGPGETGGGYLGLFDVAPSPGTGWKLIDGTGDDGSPIGVAHPIKILKSDGTTRSNITAANMTGGAYPKAAGAYNGAVTAATVPGIAGSTATVGVSGGVGSAAANGHTHVMSLPGDPVAHTDWLPYLRK